MSDEITGYYNPRYYHKTKLYQIIKNNLDKFLEKYPERFEEKYGELRPEVEIAFRKFLSCGNPINGFAKYECPDCKGFFIVPFSCKTWCCPSCSERRVLEWADWLIQEVVYDMPHFFMTYTMPKSVREYFFQNRWLIPYLEKSLVDMLSYYLKNNCEQDTAVPGIILVPQTFGEKLNANLHFHLLVTTMCVEPDTGGYYETKLPNFFEMRHAWKNKVLSLLLNMKIITRKEYLKFRTIYNKGFHFHVSNPENKTVRDINEIEQTRMEIIKNIGKYLVRTPLSEAKIINYNKKTNEVTIRYKKYEFEHKGKLKKTKKYGLERMDALELMARLSIHVPQPRKHKVKYYGAYSTRFRGRFRASGNRASQTSQNVDRTAYNKKWSELIFKIYQDDPLLCPVCEGELKLTEIFSVKEAKQEFRKLKIKANYIGRNGFLYKEQFYNYFDTA